MGCCASTPRADQPESQQATRASTASSTADGAQPSARVLVQAGTSTSPNSQSHPNAPLRAPKVWRATSKLWTPAKLEKERAAFFDTRVTGNSEAWAAIRLATEMARGGAAAGTSSATASEGAHAAAQPDLKGAQAILDAAGLTVPTGRLSEGIWDERGTLYKLPRWVVSDPQNIAAEDQDEDDDEIEGDADGDVEVDEAKDGLSDDEDGAMEAEKKTVTKGKERARPDAAVAPPKVEVEMMRIKARLSDRATDVTVHVEKDANVRAIVKRVSEAAEVPSETRVRLAYMGRILKENQSLQKQGWDPSHVVNALVFGS